MTDGEHIHGEKGPRPIIIRLREENGHELVIETTLKGITFGRLDGQLVLIGDVQGDMDISYPEKGDDDELDYVRSWGLR